MAKKLAGNDLLQSFDARDWAKAFVETVREKPSIATDEGTMLSWFANALMRGYDECARAVGDAQRSTQTLNPTERERAHRMEAIVGNLDAIMQFAGVGMTDRAKVAKLVQMLLNMPPAIKPPVPWKDS